MAAESPDSPLVPTWVRVLVVLTVMPVWTVVVLWSLLVQDRLPETPLMMVPSAVIVAVAPNWRRSGAGNNPPAEPDPPAPAPPTPPAPPAVTGGGPT